MDGEKKVIKANVIIETIQKCLKPDIVPGKPYCMYKHDKPKNKQPKGWPKHYKTKTDAERHLKFMKIFDKE